MYSGQIQKWGNSHGIRLPKKLLDAMNIQENDRVDIIPSEDGFMIKKSTKARHKTIQERLETFYMQPLETIEVEETSEFDWGKAKGDEIW